MKKFRCTVCGYVYEGDAAPEKCPLCKAPASKFVEVEEAQAGGPLVFADEHGIVVEKTGPYNLLFLFSIGIDKTKALSLLRALTEAG